MADKFWTHLKLKNGDKVKFVPPAPDGDQLGGITEGERDEIGALREEVENQKKDIALHHSQIDDADLRIEKLEASAEGKLYMFREDSTEAYEKAVPADALKWATLDSIGGHTEAVDGELVTYSPNAVINNGSNVLSTDFINKAYSVTKNGVTLSFDENGVITLNGTATSSVWMGAYNAFALGLPNGTYSVGFKVSGVGTNSAEVVRAGFADLGGYISFTKDIEQAKQNITYSGGIGNFDVRTVQGVTYNNAKILVWINDGATIKPYKPFLKQVSTDLSGIVSKYFPNGMKSAGSVYDEIDLERGVAVQRIGSVDLGTVQFVYDAQYPRFYSIGFTNAFGAKTVPSDNSIANILSSKYERASATNVFSKNNDMIVAIGATGTLNITDRSTSDVGDLDGVVLLYELAEPIETPIDHEDIAELTALEVEAGGSLTFTNQHGDDYRIPLPNKETFMIKL